MKGFVLKPLALLLILCIMATLVVATPVMAQEPPPTEAAGTSATASTRSDPEANLPYLFAVYTITWVGFFAYLFYLSQKQRELRREVEDLRQALAERGRRESGSR